MSKTEHPKGCSVYFLLDFILTTQKNGVKTYFFTTLSRKSSNLPLDFIVSTLQFTSLLSTPLGFQSTPVWLFLKSPHNESLSLLC